MFKKSILMSACLLLVSIVGTSSVYAEEGEGMESLVKLRLGGELLLTEVPTFSYGRISYDGTSKTVDLPETQKMTVSDKTGLGEGWRVTVSFKDTKFKTGGFKLKVTPTIDSELAIAASTTTLNGDEASVLQANSAETYTKDRNDFTFDYASGESNQLTIPDNAKSGSYATILTWNLESTP